MEMMGGMLLMIIPPTLNSSCNVPTKLLISIPEWKIMIDLTNNPWERRDGRFYISRTDQEFILVLWRGIKDSEIDAVIKRHNDDLTLKEEI
jgi:hypothetical protein